MLQDNGQCAESDLCSRLSDNTLVAAGGTAGAAAGVGLGAELNIYQTLVAHNRTANLGAQVGTVFESLGGKLRVEGVTLFANEAAELFALFGGETAEIAFVTASRNGRTPPAFPVPAHPLFTDTGATVRLNSSIFWPNNSFRVSDFDDILEADCLMVSSTTGLPSGATLISTADPLFRNAAAGDMRLVPWSPAVDFCDTALYVPTHHDRDGEPRGFDLPGNPNGLPGVAAPSGIYDLGADEVRDVIFYDGFESGSLNAWSSSSP